MEEAAVYHDGLKVLGSLSVARVAEHLGANEGGLRLVLSLLFGYPLAIIHRNVLYGTRPAYQHLFFILCGLSVGYFNYGWEVLHTLSAVVGVYLILCLTAGTVLSVGLVFLFTMSYLLAGYYQTTTGFEDLNWTMPHCVLTLRLIGLTFDIYDGTKPVSDQSPAMKKSAISFTPGLLQVAGHTYFPSSFLIGPQFSMRRYLQLVDGKYQTQGEKTIVRPGSVWLGLKKLSLGLLYLSVFQLGASYISDDYLLSGGFNALPFYLRMFVIGRWGKISMYKYIACWLMSEGVCVTTGLAYNGLNARKEVMLDGCANVKPAVFENAWKFQHIIDSFNINTNDWAMQYIYKRLRWMGNKLASQGVTLLFLAVWHGFYTGFYVCFLLEFIVMYQEKDVESILKSNQPVLEFVQRPYVKAALKLVLKIYTAVFLGYCLVPFVLHSSERWWPVYQSVYFCGHALFMFWPLYSLVIKRILRLACPRT